MDNCSNLASGTDNVPLLFNELRLAWNPAKKLGLLTPSILSALLPPLLVGSLLLLASPRSLSK